VETLFYHGGLKGKERHAVQERFMSGEVPVIVATNAFGMGVDKADVRFVYHYHPADSLDAYYQEVGRAGRDGGQAEAILFYRARDIGAQSFKTGGGTSDRRELQGIAECLIAAGGPVATSGLAKQAGLSTRKLTSALQTLEDAGIVESVGNGEVRARAGVDLDTALQQAVDDEERRREARRERLHAMRGYAESARCRREILLQHFGDDFTGPCRFCDHCEAAAGLSAGSAGAGVRREVL